MKKSRFTEEQISFALKQAETGTPVAEVIRRIWISEQTFYRWKKLYGGLGTGEQRHLKQLDEALAIANASTHTGSCRWLTRRARSRRGGTTMRAVLTLPWGG